MRAVAVDLLGCVVRRGSVAVRLTEVEAYEGAVDPASHAFRGPTARNAVMFGPPGHAYVYFTYGMHWCLNVVCGPVGVAAAVLLRAGEVVAGVATARARRPAAKADRDLARGPARLAAALGVDRMCNDANLTSTTSGLWVAGRAGGVAVPPAAVRTGPRVGVAAGAELPWRFWLDGEATVSVYRAGGPRRRQ